MNWNTPSRRGSSSNIYIPSPAAAGICLRPLMGSSICPDYTECGGDSDAWITWKLAAKYFFEPYFGGAASPFRRNVLTSTLDLTGVGFLNGPRNTSPLISRFKVRTSEHMDLEWDADYDFKSQPAGRQQRVRRLPA